jgi:hypothetical protein
MARSGAGKTMLYSGGMSAKNPGFSAFHGVPKRNIP